MDAIKTKLSHVCDSLTKYRLSKEFITKILMVCVFICYYFNFANLENSYHKNNSSLFRNEVEFASQLQVICKAYGNEPTSTESMIYLRVWQFHSSRDLNLDVFTPQKFRKT